MTTLLKIFFITITHLNIGSINNDSIIVWSKNYQLTVDDFLSENKPKADTLFYVSHSDAISSCRIKVQAINKEGIYNYYVLPYFNRNESWIRKNNKELLEHEQIHFDLTELIARKLRREIHDAQINKICAIEYYSDLINSYLSELVTANLEFDHKTMHGFINSLQQEFRNDLDCELKQLEEFSTDKNKFTPALIERMFNND